MHQWMRTIGVCVFCVGSLVASNLSVHAVQPENIKVVGDWEILPNGLIMVQSDSNGDDSMDSLVLYQVLWSGWTSQSVEEVEDQAYRDSQWVFIVEYDHDRFVYFAQPSPLCVEWQPSRKGQWSIQPVQSCELRDFETDIPMRSIRGESFDFAQDRLDEHAPGFIKGQ